MCFAYFSTACILSLFPSLSALGPSYFSLVNFMERSNNEFGSDNSGGRQVVGGMCVWIPFLKPEIGALTQT